LDIDRPVRAEPKDPAEVEHAHGVPFPGLGFGKMTLASGNKRVELLTINCINLQLWKDRAPIGRSRVPCREPRGGHASMQSL
jgi:hypothetical protein